MGIISRYIQKQVGDIMKMGESSLTFQQLFKFMSGNRVVWLNDNRQNWVKEGYIGNPYVYSCINLIANHCANVDICVGEIKNEKAVRGYKQMRRDPLLSQTKKLFKSAYLEIENHEAESILHSPNKFMSGTEFIKELISFKYIDGNGYVEGVSPDAGVNTGKFTQLYVMPSPIVVIVAGDYRQPVFGYQLEYQNYFSTIPAENVMHTKFFNPDYTNEQWLYGLSPIKAAGKPLQTSNDAYNTRKFAFQNNGMAGMLTNDSEAPLHPDHAIGVKDSWKNKRKGIDKVNDIMVSTGKFRWINFGLSPVDMNIIESLRLDKTDIAAVFNVPLELIPDSKGSTFENQKYAKKRLYTDVVIPEMNSLVEHLNKFLMPQFNKGGKKYELYCDWSKIPELQDDFSTMASQLNTAWWLTPNEKRIAMDYESIDEDIFNNIYIPSNIVPESNTKSNVSDKIE